MPPMMGKIKIKMIFPSAVTKEKALTMPCAVGAFLVLDRQELKSTPTECQSETRLQRKRTSWESQPPTGGRGVACTSSASTTLRQENCLLPTSVCLTHPHAASDAWI